VSALDELIKLEMSIGNHEVDATYRMAERAAAELAALREQILTAEEFRKCWNERDKELAQLQENFQTARKMYKLSQEQIRDLQEKVLDYRVAMKIVDELRMKLGKARILLAIVMNLPRFADLPIWKE
jgi:hypothetical protein